MKVKQLKSVLPGLKPLVAVLKTDHETNRRHSQPWRKWYFTAPWKRLRWQCFERDLFTCQMCGQADHNASRLEADHKTRHLGDPKLFWDINNLQCLCKTCHAKEKQREEAQDRAAQRVGGG